MTTTDAHTVTDSAPAGCPIQVGDLVSAHFGGRSDAHGGPYTVTGSVYWIERFPRDLWLGGEIVAYEGDLAPGVLSAVVTTPGQAPRVLTHQRAR